jgi:hypothetical protein
MPTNASSAGYLDAQIPGAFPDARTPSVASITTHQTSLSQALYDRRAEYTRPRNVRIKVGTWNTAAQKGTEQDVGAWFVKGKGVEEAMAGLGVSEHEMRKRHDMHGTHPPSRTTTSGPCQAERTWTSTCWACRRSWT